MTGLIHSFWKFLNDIFISFLTHWGRDLFICIFFNENIWISLKNSLKFTPRVRLITFQHWCRLWLGADQAISHYLNQRCIYASLSLIELKPYGLHPTIKSSKERYIVPRHSSHKSFLPLSPLGWRGIAVTVRAGGRLPNLWNPYLCNRLTDFLHWKFCGIV